MSAGVRYTRKSCNSGNSALTEIILYNGASNRCMQRVGRQAYIICEVSPAISCRSGHQENRRVPALRCTAWLQMITLLLSRCRYRTDSAVVLLQLLYCYGYNAVAPAVLLRLLSSCSCCSVKAAANVLMQLLSYCSCYTVAAAAVCGLRL